jgi:hypothetical protein
MNARFPFLLTACAAVLSAQGIQRQASITRGSTEGSCTVEVVVDGSAEVEIRGDRATLRNLSGDQAFWRRFECTSALPANPVDFRLEAVGGRGRQQLTRNPLNGGIAVVRVEDTDAGSEGYTFHLTWSEIHSPSQPVARCQDEVRNQAADRLGLNNVAFLRTVTDTNPSRRDWITGASVARRSFGRTQTYQFSCAVNLDNGTLRSIDIQPLRESSTFQNAYTGASRNTRGVEACQRAVSDRLHSEGLPNIDMAFIGVDNNHGRSDWIVGNARAGIGPDRDWFTFSCSVNLQNGSIRSVQVDRRK